MFNYQLGIIPALDVDIQKAKKIAEAVKGLKKEIAGLKIGSILCWQHGLPKVVGELKKVCDFPVIFDAQKACTDIPDIVRKQAKVVANAGVDAFIAAPQGAGSATLTAFVDACKEYQIVPIVVLEMTHPEFSAFLSRDAAERILEKSIDLGVRSFVAPANKPERLKLYKNIAKKKREVIKILSPGVGPQGGGPDTAVEAGADFVIVGRAIYKAGEPKEEVKRIYDLIDKAYSSRKE
ncbi:MAG TPA: orotidine-5'-phosphate decarboxylase [candidate division WOR-3 bacterium]|uniref:Orotidine 5'-phosphate decarboxylase n=1 Tax=candidate division WOR-3 bacterium TaxID=2052148 RepID=A0A7V0LTU5_UNCW3|nr:orotidine-5'-phosphate decarboxylase [candidate division WOR-3 bacterium]